MGRDFKFRCWNGKSMIDIMEMYYFHDVLLKYPEYKDWHTMQWSGLKDKKGVDIYEGDILDDGAVVEFFTQLHWDSGGSVHSGYYCRKWFEWGDDEGLHYGQSFEDVEVIGNIYENPELLNKENSLT